MININRYTLSNGLRVIHNEDNTTQMVALNLLYDVAHAMKILTIPDSPICLNT